MVYQLNTGAPRHYEDRGLNHRLDNVEKGRLSMLAKRAWQLMVRKGATDEDESTFRHRVSLQACNRRVSEALRGDYNKIESALLIILGETKQALRSADRDSTAGERIALVKLREELRLHGLHEGYADKICRNKFKRGLMEASPKQIWSVFYDVKKNRKRQRVAAAGSNPF